MSARPAADPWQQPLEDRFTFDALVDPLGAHAFRSDYEGTRPWVHHGDPGRFDGLLSWSALNSLIRYQGHAGQRVRLMHGGVRLPDDAYHRTVATLRGPLRLIDPARLLAELRDGATLVWDAVDQCHPTIGVVKQGLERALRSFVFVNLYATWGSAAGLREHWDDHDIFVLQLIGRKSWSVQQGSRPWPLPDDDGCADPPASYAEAWTLNPGTVLYLPRGWWHLVTPLDEPSLHLTIGVLRPTNVDLLRWILTTAQESEFIRRDLPMGMDQHARAAHAAALRSALDEWIGPDSIERFEEILDATHQLEPRPTLQAVEDPRPEMWDLESHALLLSTRGRVEVRGADVILRVAGQEFRAPTDAGPALEALVGGQRVRLRTLLDEVPSSLVSKLVTAGILAVE